jgi:hypothetical protein
MLSLSNLATYGVGMELAEYLMDNLAGYNAQWYGAKGDGSTDDTLSIQNALNAASAAANGGLVYFPPGTYLVSSPLTVTGSKVVIKIAGNIKANGDDFKVFNVSGDDVEFVGEGGSIEGPGTYRQTGATVSVFIYVTGKRCSIRDLRLLEPAQCAVRFYKTSGCRMESCIIQGGPPARTSTEHYGILIDAGSDHLVSNNQILPNATGGNCVQAISGNIPSGVYPVRCAFVGNVIDTPLEKGFYSYGHDCTIIGNTITGALESLRHIGQRNVIANNTTNGNHYGAITCYNCTDSVIANNVCLNYEQVGLFFGHINLNTDPLNNNVIVGNYFSGVDGASYEAIRYDHDGYGATNVLIANNVITGAALYSVATHGMRIGNYAGPVMTQCQIVNNILDNIGYHGILCYYLEDSIISGNIIRNVGQKSVGSIGIRVEDYCSDVTLANNYISATDSNTEYAITIRAGVNNTNCKLYYNEARGCTIVNKNPISYVPGEGHSGRGNSQAGTPLTGTFTMPIAGTLTVANDQVFGVTSPKPRIILTPLNEAAGLLQGSSKHIVVYAITGGTSFNVHTSDGTGTTGTEEFFYEIIQ